eukprot:TRINITY_DN25521_c0_g1_i1.p1 TRINITY_DN25521_c0_g1~~TRINITY_DN25521_c0_g1_i1.p1  ORF type:complete len:287 (+),score=77.99 TRINITY_DN25521_c0_g1_i1:36-896(+)
MGVLDAACRRLLDAGTPKGIDIVHPLAVGWYNDHVASSDPERRRKLLPLPEYGRGAGCAAVVVGNTKALWEPMLRWAAGKAAAGVNGGVEGRAAAAPEHPVDEYCREALEEIFAAVFPDTRYELFWSWTTGCEGKLVPLQRAAEACGLAYLDHNTHLCIHPEYGAWFSLRLVAVLDLPYHDQEGALPPARLLPCLLTEVEEAAARDALAAALAASDTDAAAMCRTMHGIHTNEWPWRKWVALRDTVRRGAAHRFSDEQLRYHYTKDRGTFVAAVAAVLRDLDADDK